MTEDAGPVPGPETPPSNPALPFLEEVKAAFGHTSETYNEFLEIMAACSTKQIDTPGAIRRIHALFAGHDRFIAGFNALVGVPEHPREPITEADGGEEDANPFPDHDAEESTAPRPATGLKRALRELTSHNAPGLGAAAAHRADQDARQHRR